MVELDRWTHADDDTIRDALALLRHDVESLPIPDVRFVKARGHARHRRAQLVAIVCAAAAVSAIAFIGFHSFGSQRSLDVGPAATATTPAPTSTGSGVPLTRLASSGPLLAASDWQRALGFTSAVHLGEMIAGEGVSTCVRKPGTLLAIDSVSSETLRFGAVQGTYRAASPTAGNAAAAFAVSQLVGCQERGANYKVEADAAWPKVLSATATDGAKQWFIVAHHDALTSLVALGDPGSADSATRARGFSLDQIQAVALVAQQRLVQEVEGSPPATSRAAR